MHKLFTTFHAGAGMYVGSSYYFDSKPVANNTLIVKKSYSCNYCEIAFYCYSNSSSSSVGHVRFPTNTLLSDYREWNHWNIGRQSPSGILVRNYRYYDPYYWGIFTCEIPDSNGITLEVSIGAYSSMPSM